MATYHLHRWSVIDTDPYAAPEARKLRLRGYRDQDAKRVHTSMVVEVRGREVETYSGSIYILEDIDPDYLDFLEELGEVYDPENPIRVKKC
jgi:hypothetical protein